MPEGTRAASWIGCTSTREFPVIGIESDLSKSPASDTPDEFSEGESRFEALLDDRAPSGVDWGSGSGVVSECEPTSEAG
jgi:hypothetical protein